MARIALLGRPNVGKSSLFNALTETSAALVAPTPGVTRDWRSGTVVLDNNAIVELIDTAGLDESGDELADRLTSIARAQAQEADAILFVIDGKDGILPADEAFAQEVRRLNKPTLLVINKGDTAAAADTEIAAMALGLGESLTVSAAHTMGISYLKEWMENYAEAPVEKAEETTAVDPATIDFIEEHDETVKPKFEAEEGPIRLAVVGRPNAGKSTLINHLIKEDRMLTGEMAGLTRESISVPWKYGEEEYVLIDTPGQRRRARVTEELEQAMVQTAQTSVDDAQVVILVVDASGFNADEGISKIFHQQDAAIAQQAIELGRSLVVAVNKWDIVEDKAIARDQIIDHVTRLLHNLAGVPVIPISAVRGKGIPQMMAAVRDVYQKMHTTASTSQLNRILEVAQKQKSAPLANGRSVRMKYMTQVGICPPAFAVWGSRVATLPDSYKRYLTNVLRDQLKIRGIPVRMFFKMTDNPFDKKKK